MGIAIFSGTSEGRRISEYLSFNKVFHDVCVATKSGENVMGQTEYAKINVGRLTEDEIKKYLTSNDISIVVDATHPYADIVTDNLKRVCDGLEITYIRVNRDSNSYTDDVVIETYSSAGECAEALCREEGNILLTTGSKELSTYMIHGSLKNRIYVRVLPSIEAIEICNKAEVNEKNIIAMYGPHSSDVNEALIKQYNIKHMVTKESGRVGGFSEKLIACKATNVKLHIIERPENAKGISVRECVGLLNDMLNIGGSILPNISIKLIGIGPGNSLKMTEEARREILDADYLFGASRMLESCDCKGTKINEYLPDRIIEKLDYIISNELKDEIKVAALFSGDTGIYSGASKLYKYLNNWGKCSGMEIIPGVSSFSAFSAAIGSDYQNSYFESLHGKSNDEENISKISKLICNRERVFLLMSNKSDFDVLQKLIPDGDDVNIIVGYNISYPTQEIIYTNSNDVKRDIENLDDGLFIVLIDSGCN